MTPRPIVVALGGNALLRRGEPTDATTQRRNVARATQSLAALAARGPLVVTHGNGPQVGLLALQAAAYDGADPYPLDVLGAESEGMIGYLLEQELRNALPGRDVATLLTQVVVDPDDQAFTHPSKPIGPTYSAQQTDEVRARGWTVGRDGASWRRVVASPEPQQIVELSTIRLLLAAGTIVICVGGGGIPVTRVDGHVLQGVEAVIDKDLAAALLAVELDAGALLLLTDVTAVQDGWDTDAPRPIRRATPDELRARTFAGGSMGPKVEAAARFAEQTGRAAAIGALDEAALLLDGIHGTTVTLDASARTEQAPGGLRAAHLAAHAES
jgi:carbamate kinase